MGRPKRSKIPRTIIEDLGSNKTRDKNITPTEQNASDQVIQIMAMNIKLEPVLTTYEVDEEQGKITVDRLDDCEEERLAVQGPSSINVKVNKASKVYEVKYSKNGQVQTYNHKKAEHPNKKGKAQNQEVYAPFRKEIMQIQGPNNSYPESNRCSEYRRFSGSNRWSESSRKPESSRWSDFSSNKP